MKILVVEDEIKVAEVLKRGLEEAGYDIELAFDGQMGWHYAQGGDIDLFILDINLPQLNGLELCKLIRSQDEYTPVLMLTALGMSEDIVTGLEAGADDYIAKPFRFNELFARIKALSRRTNLARQSIQSEQIERLQFADLCMDMDAKEVRRGDTKIKLTAREFSLLEYLMRNAGKVCSRSEIAKAVWRLDFETGTNFVDVYINYLRNKLDKPFKTKLIHTHTGFGYTLKEEAVWPG